jgi:hypothetical protein
MILHVLIAMVAGWLQRHQQHVITYLITVRALHHGGGAGADDYAGRTLPIVCDPPIIVMRRDPALFFNHTRSTDRAS